MRVVSVQPEDLEMPFSGFAGYLTPADLFFVRTHVYVPSVELSSWRLRIDSLELTYEELTRMPSTEVIAVAECAGNGRKFFDPPVPGLQWGHGAVANARWRGVRLADVLKRAGIKPSAKEVLFDGADMPLGTMPDFRRGIPIQKALDPNTLLAFEMNGEKIPSKHGFPVRVVVPGWASDSWVKWLTGITVLDRESDGFWMKTAYRKPEYAAPPGSVIPADKMQPVTSLRVKSVIAAPLDGALVKPGTTVMIQGVAWSGDSGPVTSVEVSTDGGRTWKPAALAKDQATRFGWRQWSLTWTPPREAYYTIMARARNSAGEVQPFAQEWNPAGYGWNVVHRAGINVATSAAPTPADETRSEPIDPKLRSACVACHRDDVIRQQRLTRDQWDRELTKMANWGAQVKPEERSTLLDYLSRTFGIR